MSPIGRRIEVRVIVQGVGFRPWVYQLARNGGVTGRVHNDAAGVVIDAFGPEAALDAFAERLLHEPPAAADIIDVTWRAIPAESLEAFTIAQSEDRKSTRLNSSHEWISRMPSSA